jgi:uncharacterized membrane protein
MTNWLEHSAQVEVETPIEVAWNLLSDLEQMPKWMKWVDSVKRLEEDPDLSRWKFASPGFDSGQLLRTTKSVTHQIIQWESVDGVPTKGAIRFYDRGDRCIVKLTLGYAAIPGIVGKIVDNLFVGRMTESSMQADLNRFREYALKAYARE